MTDDLGATSPINNLDIVITDSSPVAVNDSASITEDAAPNTVSGTVLSNDTVGADSNATPISAYSGNLTYGSLVLNSDGTYSYTLNNANPAVNALNNGQTLIDSYTYTLTDGDGTTTTAVLNITINGNTDGAPSVSIPDTNGLAAGDSTLPETAGATAGSFSVSTPAGLASISVGGTTVTEAQLGNLGSSQSASTLAKAP
ncbi:VCBS domain-containing protein [Methylotenera sp. L2L1]|uniref:VCBS domain-containing protein n=1 Tax=Methylotenera sp. L2L1 TaxID=1502770 RepID=UPI00056D8EB3|nr:VCBS domain-containing protein [Methylotenera sp. L2L1]